MSAIQSYPCQPRSEFGKKAAQRLRASGQVPVTISRPGQASHQLAIAAKAAAHLDANVVHLCRISVGDTTVTTLRGDVVKDVMSEKVIHIDLLEVDEKATIDVEVAVRPLAGNCPGVKAGGVVELRQRRVSVRCPALAIPDFVDADLAEVQLMQTILVGTIKLPAGVTMLTDAKKPLLSVVIPRGMKKGDEDAAAAAATAAAASAEGEKKDGEAAPAAGKADAKAPGKSDGKSDKKK